MDRSMLGFCAGFCDFSSRPKAKHITKRGSNLVQFYAGSVYIAGRILYVELATG